MHTSESDGLNLIATQKFAVVLVCPAGYVHSLALLEVAETIHFALQNLGLDSILTDANESSGRKNIILGGHLIKNVPGYSIPKDSIIYNFEQIDPNSNWIDDFYVDLLKSHKVWDYSLRNIELLNKFGIHHAEHLPLGYVYQLSRISTSEPKDIDVLFYGSMNARRENILSELKAFNVNVVNVFGVYGNERDRLISRSKIVLNIHYYESKIFEIARISYLLSNSICVVSETGPDSIEKNFTDGLAFSSYEDLSQTCVTLLNDSEKRDHLAYSGKKIIQSFNQMELLKPLLFKLFNNCN